VELGIRKAVANLFVVKSLRCPRALKGASGEAPRPPRGPVAPSATPRSDGQLSLWSHAGTSQMLCREGGGGMQKRVAGMFRGTLTGKYPPAEPGALNV
jgi:hypothetical protein